MTTLTASPSPAETLLADLTPASGLALRRWTPDEFRRLSSSGILSADGSLDLADGEIIDCDSRAPYLFNRDEYYSLAEQGTLGPEERTELIYGRIITRMSPMSRPHSLVIAKTADALEAAFGSTVAVENQLAVHLDSGLEPQPDVVVLRGASEDYPEVPRPADVLLLVEVSVSTLSYDRNTKSRMYAENGIADYWIVNVNSRTLEVRRRPENGAYLSLTVYNEQDTVAPLAAPNAPVRVAELLPMVGATCPKRKPIVNTCFATLCIALSCLAVPARNVMADQKPLPPVGAAQALTEKDFLGDWQTQGEGWRIRLNGDHTAAIYSEGVLESSPSFTTWKLVSSHVIFGSTSLFKLGPFEDLGGDFIVIPSWSSLVMLPKNELPVAEKRGFVACSCLWHSNRQVNVERK